MSVSAKGIKKTRLFVPEVIAGRYELLHKIASGGMATIYLARIKGLVDFQKFVAVKIIHPHLSEDDEFKNMFLDEATITSKLNHPNISQVIDLGEQDDILYMVMEYVEGESLATLVSHLNKENKPLSYTQAAWIVSQAAAGLHYVHSLKDPQGNPLNIVHRDISPQNIMVTYEGYVKLIDFGIAKGEGRKTHTETGIVKGKYAYMSPEQASGLKLDLRSDLYSLGIILYEISLNKRLYKFNNELAIVNAILYLDIANPKSINTDYPDQLEKIVTKTLQKDKELRYQNTLDFQVDLEKFISNSGETPNNYLIGNIMRSIFPTQIELKKTLRFSPSSYPGTVSFDEVTEKSKTMQNSKNSLTLATSSTTIKQTTTSAALKYRLPILISTLLLLIVIAIELWKINQPSDTVRNTTLRYPRILISAGKKLEVQNEVGPTLKVSSNPENAELFINDEPKGNTPIKLEHLPVNTKIILKLSHNGFKDATREIMFKSAHEQLDITLELSKAITHHTKIGKIKSIQKTDKIVHEIEKNEDNQVQQIVEQKFGFINIDSNPWATVLYNNQKLGITPMVRVRLPVGKVNIKLLPLGKEPAKTYQINIEENKIKGYRFDL